jgi:hypothetical protein
MGRAAIASGANWEPLTVDLPIAPQSDERWIVHRVTLHGEAAVNPQSAQSPCSGIFLVSPGTRPESLADGQAGWSVEARGVPMPSGIVINYSFLPSSGRYAYVISLTQSNPQPIDPDTTIRAVLSCNPGSAQPGPGGGSFGILTVMGYREFYPRGR